jgi:putative peptide zinc metalloprotease protein
VQLTEVDITGSAYLEQPALASDQGGPIAVSRDAQQRPAPKQGQYGVRLMPQDELQAPRQPQVGVVVLQGKGESILGAVWRRVAALGVRESGF